MKIHLNRKLGKCVLFIVVISILTFILRCTGFADNYREIMSLFWMSVFLLLMLYICNDLKEKYIIASYSTLIINEILIIFNVFSSINEGSDAVEFIRVADLYYNNDFSAFLTYFPYLINIEYKFFGRNVFLVEQLGVIMTTLSVTVLVGIMDELNISDSIQKLCLTIAILSPDKFVYSSVVLREPIYILCITLSFYFFIKWEKTHKRSLLFMCLIIVLPCMVLHTGFVMVTISYLLILLIGKELKSSSKIFCLIICLLVLAIIISTSKNNKLAALGPEFISSYEYSYVYNKDAGSLYLTWMHPSNWIQVILYTPVRMFYFWFSPLPGGWNSLAKVASFFLDSIYYVITLMSFIIMFNRKNDYNHMHIFVVKAIVVILILYSAVFSWGTVTAGTALRHRNCMINLCILIIAICLNKKAKITGYQNESVYSKTR